MINPLKGSESAVFRLRSLYESKGYLHFKMSKFEEYDIYAENKDFLAGENIITFTDTDGRLMALKPDVTISIIRNFRDSDGVTEKLYYNENVYRSALGSHEIKELMQSGLECIGDIDTYNTCEVISMAAMSLGSFERECVLDISHMGIISGVIDSLNVSDFVKKELIRCVGAKNTHEIRELLGDKADCLISLLNLDPDPDKAVAALEGLAGSRSLSAGILESIGELKSILDVLKNEEFYKNLRIDFSVVQDITYYNGIVFQGFINGIPEKILTGGRYDLLMRRMGKKGGAIGFGINIDLLERVLDKPDEFDADIAVIYHDGDDPGALVRLSERLCRQGLRVAMIRKPSERAKYRHVAHFGEEGYSDVR